MATWQDLHKRVTQFNTVAYAKYLRMCYYTARGCTHQSHVQFSTFMFICLGTEFYDPEVSYGRKLKLALRHELVRYLGLKLGIEVNIIYTPKSGLISNLNSSTPSSINPVHSP